MSSYRLLLRETSTDGGKTAEKISPMRGQCHTCSGKLGESYCCARKIIPRGHTHAGPADSSHQVGTYVDAIHGHGSTSSAASTIDPSTRLRAMLKILRKLLVAAALSLSLSTFLSLDC